MFSLCLLFWTLKLCDFFKDFHKIVCFTTLNNTTIFFLEDWFYQNIFFCQCIRTTQFLITSIVEALFLMKSTVCTSRNLVYILINGGRATKASPILVNGENILWLLAFPPLRCTIVRFGKILSYDNLITISTFASYFHAQVRQIPS